MFDYLEQLETERTWERFTSSIFNLLGNSNEADYLENVSVLGSTSLIVDSKRNIVRSTLNEHLYWSPHTLNRVWFEDKKILNLMINERFKFLDAIKRLFFKMLGADQTEVFSDDYTYIYIAHAFGWYAFGHLHDSLQRLFSVRNLLVEGKVKLVVSDPYRIVNFHLHLSALIGFEVNESDLIVLNPKTLYSFKKLVVPYSPAIATNYTKETYAWVARGYLTKFVDQSDHSQLSGIYLSRNHVSPGTRSVTNEPQIIDYLSAKGFKVLYGTESLSEIVNSFYRAKVVIGPHGSLFANTIYCQDDCKIYEFCADNRVDHSFRNKFKAAKHYEHQLCPADSAFNIEIPIKTLEAIFNR